MVNENSSLDQQYARTSRGSVKTSINVSACSRAAGRCASSTSMKPKLVTLQVVDGFDNKLKLFGNVEREDCKFTIAAALFRGLIFLKPVEFLKSRISSFLFNLVNTFEVTLYFGKYTIRSESVNEPLGMEAKGIDSNRRSLVVHRLLDRKLFRVVWFAFEGEYEGSRGRKRRRGRRKAIAHRNARGVERVDMEGALGC